MTKKNKQARGGLAAAKASEVENAGQKRSKCAFIDALYTGKSVLTQSEILEKTLAQFPDANKKSTLATIKARPGHIRKAGGDPKWKPEPKAEDKAA